MFLNYVIFIFPDPSYISIDVILLTKAVFNVFTRAIFPHL